LYNQNSLRLYFNISVSSKIAMKITLFLLIAFEFAFQIGAQNLAMSSNPYAPVVERNVFGLVPIPTNPPVDTTPATPPPKITPNGIMSIFGQFQVLFKVATPAKPGQPQKDDSYVLGEGQRQDDIEVKKIDEKNNLITFNNHGTIQMLALANAPTISAPSSAPVNMGMPQRGPGFPRTRPDGLNPFGGSRGAALRNRVASGGNTGAPGSVPGFSSGNVTASGNNNSDSSGLSPEAQVIAIEANRIATQDDVNSGKLPPLPPTVLTPDDATGQGGAPLITPAEPAEPPPPK
jgi:hypothetical protein